MKFKNYIETESGIKDTSSEPGTAGQVLSSTGTGTSWIDQGTLVSAASKLVVIACKNTSGSTINKGTPVYQTGTVGATEVIEVAPADATISTGYLPAIGILQTTLIHNNDPVTDPGNVVITGEFLNYNTLDIPSNNPGGVPITGDTVYLAVGGGLTCIKPTGAGNAIQNLGLIGKVSGGTAGSITVSSIMRANDVPNLPTGRIWIGDGNTIVSDTVYVDEPNGRVGIGNTSPQAKLHIGTNNGFNGTLEELRITPNTSGGIGGSAVVNLATGQYGDSGIYFGNSPNYTSQPASVQYQHLTSTLKYTTNSFHTFFVGASQKMVINSVGNVGIGTTVPSSKLQVVASLYGPIDFTQRSAILGLNDSTDTFYANSVGVAGRVKTLNGRAIYGKAEGGGWGGYFDGKGFFSSNVGIGTASPLAKLQVTGNPHNSNFDSGCLVIQQDSGDRMFIDGNDIDAADSTLFLNDYSLNPIKLGGVLQVGNSGNSYFTGNVGIGITIPQAKLDVEGNANIGSLHTNFAGASYNVNLGFQNYNNGFAAIATGQNTLADASQSFSMGFQSKATGVASLAGGNVNSITALSSESAGQASIAFGNGVKTNSNANFSQAFGRNTETGGGLTSANQAMAMGFSSIAFGDNSFSGGNNSRAFGEASFAFGEGAVGSKGDGNIALGIGVTTPASASAANGVGQVAVGKYNVYNTGGVSHLFAVGAGTSDGSRFNAFNVTSNGRIGINGITNPNSILHAKLNDYSTGFWMEGPSFSTSFNYMAFYGGTTFRGSINPTGTNGILYSSASDYRLKENVTKLQNSIERIKKLKPSNFNFLEDPSKNVDGFIAHEVQEVVPQAVTGKKDAVGPNGDPIYQAIDQAKIVPLLTAALQESITKIEQLEQRIQTLENK